MWRMLKWCAGLALGYIVCMVLLLMVKDSFAITSALFHAAATRDHARVVELLAYPHVNVDDGQHSGFGLLPSQTPLSIAAQVGHVGVRKRQRRVRGHDDDAPGAAQRQVVRRRAARDAAAADDGVGVGGVQPPPPEVPPAAPQRRADPCGRERHWWWCCAMRAAGFSARALRTAVAPTQKTQLEL